MNHLLQKPLITTIIPTYRRPKLLRRAICSVLNQTYPHFQVCVYDNASGDETAEVVAEIAKKDSRVKYHCHSENIGSAKNFAFGMKHVDTPFFSFLADDDLLVPNFYQITLEGFNKYPEAMFSTTGYISIDEKMRPRRIGLRGWQNGIYYPPDGFIKDIRTAAISILTTLYRREVIEKAGLIDENFTYFIDEYIPRLTTKLPYVVSTIPCYITWIHESSASNAGKIKASAFFSDFNLFIDKTRQWVLSMDIPEEIRQDIISHVKQMRKPTIYYYLCLRSILNKDFGNAAEAIDILREKLNAKRVFGLELTLRFLKTFPWILNFIYPLLEIQRYVKSYKNRWILHSAGYLEDVLQAIRKASSN